jgi:hypothetical protein
MATVLFIVGLVCVVIGLIVFLRPEPKPKPKARGEEAVAAGIGAEIAEVVEALNKMLDKFDKRFRPGMFLIFIGLALIGVAAFLEANDAKDAAESTSALLVAPGLIRFRQL